MSKLKKIRLDGVEYEIGGEDLQIASATTLGGIKVGNNLTINSETGVLDADAQPIELDEELDQSSSNAVTNSAITNGINNVTANLVHQVSRFDEYFGSEVPVGTDVINYVLPSNTLPMNKTDDRLTAYCFTCNENDVPYYFEFQIRAYTKFYFHPGNIVGGRLQIGISSDNKLGIYVTNPTSTEMNFAIRMILYNGINGAVISDYTFRQQEIGYYTTAGFRVEANSSAFIRDTVTYGIDGYFSTKMVGFSDGFTKNAGIYEGQTGVYSFRYTINSSTQTSVWDNTLNRITTIEDNPYVLPTATTDTLGGVKIDDTTIKINDSVISAVQDQSGVASEITSDRVVNVIVDNDTIKVNEDNQLYTEALFEQMQSDWDEDDTTAVEYIKNKPAIPDFPDNKLSIDSNHSIQNQIVTNAIGPVIGFPLDLDATTYDFTFTKPVRHIIDTQVLVEYYGLVQNIQYLYQSIVTFATISDKQKFYADWYVGAINSDTSVSMTYRNKALLIGKVLDNSTEGHIGITNIQTYRYSSDGTMVEQTLSNTAQFYYDDTSEYSGIVVNTDALSYIRFVDGVTLYNTNVNVMLNSVDMQITTMEQGTNYNFTFNGNLYIPWNEYKKQVKLTTKLIGSTSLTTTAQTITDAINELELTKLETLPKATTSSLGAVIPDGSTILIDNDGVITATGGGGQEPYTLPIASANRLGGIKPDETTIVVNSETGVASVIGGGSGNGYIITVEGYDYAISRSIDENGDLIETYTLVE